MATTPDVSRRIDIDLRSLTAETDFLPELAADWGEECENSRANWYLEWRDLLARLLQLDQAYRTGCMSAEQRQRYRALLSKLREFLPHLHLVGVLPLPVSLELDAPR
ncbi:MAG: hypothetical protein HY690_03645 [Chloroflexi bacterium]|nr:hypothetical protein [Chloroflexota bacterium]